MDPTENITPSPLLHADPQACFVMGELLALVLFSLCLKTSLNFFLKSRYDRKLAEKYIKQKIKKSLKKYKDKMQSKVVIKLATDSLIL